MKYAALMFDIVESRQYLDRYAIQDLVMQSVGYLNHIYKENIKKEVVPSAGDEFQGLFVDLKTAFLYIRKLQLLIYPVKIRSGIGYGEIKYDKNEWTSSAFDGETYYLARDAINAISKRKSNIVCINTNSPYDKYINMFCLSNADVKSRQSQVARWIELLADIITPMTPIEEDIRIYYDILQIKAHVFEKERWNIMSKRPRELEFMHTNFDYLFENKSKYRIEEYDGHSLYFKDFWEYGMSTDIAQAMDTSRQNVDRYVALGKIKESRTIDKTIYELLKEIAK